MSEFEVAYHKRWLGMLEPIEGLVVLVPVLVEAECLEKRDPELLSDDPSYTASGYAEAIVYRHEYSQYLTGWPKAVLVTSQATHGAPHHDHDVVAVAWSELSSSTILDGVLDMLR